MPLMMAAVECCPSGYVIFWAFHDNTEHRLPVIWRAAIEGAQGSLSGRERGE